MSDPTRFMSGMDLGRDLVELLQLGDMVRKVTIEADVREAALVTVERFVPAESGIGLKLILQRYELKKVE